MADPAARRVLPDLDPLLHGKTYGTLGGVIGFLVWLGITNQAILVGAQLNAERERSNQIEAGVPGAERDLKLPARDQPKPKQGSPKRHRPPASYA